MFHTVFAGVDPNKYSERKTYTDLRKQLTTAVMLLKTHGLKRDKNPEKWHKLKVY